jgi:hypothetical protein
MCIDVQEVEEVPECAPHQFANTPPHFMALAAKMSRVGMRQRPIGMRETAFGMRENAI